MLDRIRRRLTMGYVGILALILILFGLIVVVSFSRQVTAQQDQLLEEKARSEVESVVDGGRYGGIKATTESDIAVVAIPPDGSTGEVLDLGDSSSSLGLPFSDLARKA